MSGHSKWSQIKHKKALTDAKKSKIFGKIAKLITIATREKGGNPETNSGLRLAIDKARSMNMTADNIERAIKRGTGEIEGVRMEEILYEAYGPGGIALIIEGITDNKNRTLSETRHILSQNNSKLAENGSVIWLFDKRFLLEIKLTDNNSKTKEDLELIAIESGAEDFNWLENNSLKIFASPDKLDEIKDNLEKQNIIIDSSTLEWIPKNPLPINDQKVKEQINKVFEALDEHDDINEIYSNLKE